MKRLDAIEFARQHANQGDYRRVMDDYAIYVTKPLVAALNEVAIPRLVYINEHFGVASDDTLRRLCDALEIVNGLEAENPKDGAK